MLLYNIEELASSGPASCLVYLVKLKDTFSKIKRFVYIKDVELPHQASRLTLNDSGPVYSALQSGALPYR